MNAAPPLSVAQRRALAATRLAWLALIALCIGWELWLAPLRAGGSWLALKAVPLLLPWRGPWRGDVRAMQWTLLLVLAYALEGLVRAFEPAPYGSLARLELALVTTIYVGAIIYLRPFKRAASDRRKAADAATVEEHP